MILSRFEFHISRKARRQYGFDETLFNISGDIIFPNFQAVQKFSRQINDERTRKSNAGESLEQVAPGDLNAMGLFHEVLHYVISSYLSEISPASFEQLEKELRRSIGRDFDSGLSTFVDLFPPTSVYRREESPNDYLVRSTGRLSNRQVSLIELILLRLQNENPAFASISELIEDSQLKNSSRYEDIISGSDEFFETQPKFPSVALPLIKMLRSPIETHPNSITEQLLFMAKNWEKILAGSPYLLRILNALDILKEEGKYFLMLAQAIADKNKMPQVRQADFYGFGAGGSSHVLGFGLHENETENFSPDLGWMPNLVLIAKSTFVWLDQLSKIYRRAINRLDQIPDEELDTLSKRGFTGLWLIGVWERSHASQKIKHLNGNLDAAASAYSLNSYEIALELGGDEAYQNLRTRAMNYGIRLASDMVPNHMGVDSTWVLDHPRWFLGTDHPPFPNYSFNGPDLSMDNRVGVFIEDGYWSKRDAAVVFKRLDRWTGSVEYLYHGNDGTHMPWNDTAQLDFTNPEVREAVIRTIIHVARKFSIIRFDAAMVLAKKHIQRLWFPEPGTGGAIPSRSNFSMTKERFDSVMPNEFWREVVDRIQREVPDTLLLAEAFWLMEGYFVRTLGMHRVYNSAFMNMLKREENANYRQVMKNILEYNPQILKRFVNFVNNPDEETAIAQFGRDDKYFGVCVMMATMPGLPMFGHGQVEGFTEKYGMEYKRAYRDEVPDENLVSRHEREIFPLIRKRQLFSEMDNFLLFDLSTGDGSVNEDVFAYSNRNGEERTLVVFNNRYSQASGWIKNSVGFLGENGKISRKQLKDGLHLNDRAGEYLVFEDIIAHLEYIRPVKLLRSEGLYVELGAYKYNVFLNFREVESTSEKPYGELCSELDGIGVPSIDEAVLDYRLRNVHAAFYEAMNAGSLNYLLSRINDPLQKKQIEDAFTDKRGRLSSAISEFEHLRKRKADASTRPNSFRALLSIREKLEELKNRKLLTRLPHPTGKDAFYGWRLFVLWIILEDAADATGDGPGVSIFDRWRLIPQIAACYRELGLDDGVAKYEVRLIQELLKYAAQAEIAGIARTLLNSLGDKSVQALLGVNTYEGITWFNKERFEDLLEYLTMAVLIRSSAYRTEEGSDLVVVEPKKLVSEMSRIEALAESRKYRLNFFIEELSRIEAWKSL